MGRMKAHWARELEILEASAAELHINVARALERVPESTDVRVYLTTFNGEAQFHICTGDFSYDTAHIGWCGAGHVPSVSEHDRIGAARQLVDDAIDCCAQMA